MVPKEGEMIIMKGKWQDRAYVGNGAIEEHVNEVDIDVVVGVRDYGEFAREVDSGVEVWDGEVVWGKAAVGIGQWFVVVARLGEP